MPTHAAAIVLAAGKGTRMKSDLPKVLHPVCGLPMVEHVVRALRGAGVGRVVVVIGHGGEKVQEALGEAVEYAWQREQLGTGHAVRCASDALKGHEGPIIVASGDTPLVDTDAMAALLASHEGRALTVATAFLEDPHGYGRIVRLLHPVRQRGDRLPGVAGIEFTAAGDCPFACGRRRPAGGSPGGPYGGVCFHCSGGCVRGGDPGSYSNHFPPF